MTHDEWLDQKAQEIASFVGPEEGWGIYRDWLVSTLATRPAPGRAEVEKAVERVISHASESEWGDSPALIAARAAVLARMQTSGKVYEVQGDLSGQGRVVYVGDDYREGQKVRVSRVAE